MNYPTESTKINGAIVVAFDPHAHREHSPIGLAADLSWAPGSLQAPTHRPIT